MFKKALAIACLAIGMNGAANATVIGADAFVSPTTINFADATAGAIGSQYAALGITFVNFSLDIYKTSNAPDSNVALKFFASAPQTDGELLFSSAITRLGFDASTNPEDDTTLFAYLGNTLVGTALFDTFGDGLDGSFLGIEFASGFDRVIVRTGTAVNGAIAIDNVRFEADAPTDVPEPGMLSLLGVALMGMAVIRRRRR